MKPGCIILLHGKRKQFSVSSSNTHDEFHAVLRNIGKAFAKYVKISLINKSETRIIKVVDAN